MPGVAELSLVARLAGRCADMPSVSPKQARMMAAAAHNPTFAKKVGVSTKVAKEFNKADVKTGILKKSKKKK